MPIWYDQLTDGQRASVLAFALGYLSMASRTEPKTTEKKTEQLFSQRLLRHMSNAAEEAKAEEDDGISVAKTLIKSYCDKQGVTVTNLDEIAPHVQYAYDNIIANAVHEHGKLEEDEE